MIASMTGFARAERALPEGRLTWELRTVNHRYLEMTPRLPEEWRALEPAVREMLAAGIRRGKLEAQLRFYARSGAGPEPHLEYHADGGAGATLRPVGD